MAKQDNDSQVDTTVPEATVEADSVETLPFNPKDVPGSAETILYTPTGHAFQSNVEGVDTITESGLRVPKDKVDAVIAASAPFGEGYLRVYTDKG